MNVGEKVKVSGHGTPLTARIVDIHEQSQTAIVQLVEVGPARNIRAPLANLTVVDSGPAGPQGPKGDSGPASLAA